MTEQDLRILVSALVPAVREGVERLLVHERMVGELALKTALGPVTERLAALEARPLLPGPPGEKGAPGTDGMPGRDGIDGRPGLSYVGVYQDGKAYDLGELVTWAGSAWHCNEATTTKPGDGSKAWTLMVKRGRDGKDLREGRDRP